MVLKIVGNVSGRGKCVSVKMRFIARSTAAIIVTIAIITVLVLSGCTSTETKTDVETSPDNPVLTSTPVTVYQSTECNCCSQHVAYLKSEGFQVTVEYYDDGNYIREKYPVPMEMRSCHITVVKDYFVEGHMPVEAIFKLMKERPAIDGIVLPGMPSGSPGMQGEQTETLVIYAISDGRISEFMSIGEY